MLIPGVLSTLLFILGSLANNNGMSLNSPFQSNWNLSPKYQQDEIIFEDLPQEISISDGNENRNNLDMYEAQQHEKDIAYSILNFNNGELPPQLRSVSSRITIERKKFAPICRTVKNRRRIGNDLGSEYRPEVIDEFVCAHPYNAEDANYFQHNNKVCGVAGFHCVQRHAIIHVSRKAIGSEFWLLETFRIANGCECMWPTQEHGDIERHHYSKNNNTKHRCVAWSIN